MKLYFSSYRIPKPEDLLALIEKPAEKIAAGIITNAKDLKPEEERVQKLEDVKNYLTNLGISRSVFIDLRQYEDTTQMGRALTRFDMLFVAGGNSFVLNDTMAKTGFKAIARTLLEAGVCYVGESAGAVVAGPSLVGFELMDDANQVGDLQRTGLEIIPQIIVPHNDSPDERYVGRAAHIQVRNPGVEVIALNDNQAYIVHNSTARTVAAPVHA